MSQSHTTAARAACLAVEDLESVALGHDVSASVRQHLVECETCRRAVERVREDNRFLSGFAIEGGLPRPRPAVASRDVRIPGFDIVREIHRGGQGVVYQALQQSTKRSVAIKVMRQGPFASLADRGRFDREIETLGRLDHPNIVAVHDAGVAAGFHYFVMNYVDGLPLDEWTVARDDPAAGRRPIEATLAVFIKVCDAVHAAHLRGVIHRDLKPSNIRVDGNDQPHVLDFGLAKSVDTPGDSVMTHTGQFVGSLPWASPEQVEGHSSKIDLRTDVYSLGAILFQLLTGAMPFDVGSNLRDALDNIVRREPPRPSSISAAGGRPINDELDTIVLKCLSKEPERRYQSAGDLARDLRHYLAGEPIEAKRDSAMYVFRKALRRHRVSASIASAFVLLLIGFSVVMALLYSRSTMLERQAVQSAASLSDLLKRSSIEQGRMAGMLGNVQQSEALLWSELLLRREPGEAGAVRVNEPPGAPEVYWALWELYRRNPCLLSVTTSYADTVGSALSADGTMWLITADHELARVDAFGTKIESFPAPRSERPFSALIQPSGNFVLTDSAEKLQIWRRGERDRVAMTIPRPASVALYSSRDAVCETRFAGIVGDDVVVWSFEPLVEVGRFRLDGRSLTAMAISGDGARLAARDDLGGIAAWEIDTRRMLCRAFGAGAKRPSAQVMGDLLFSPDGTKLADAWEESAGRIWSLTSDPPTAVDLSERSGAYRTLCFDERGERLAVGELGGPVREFDVRTGRRLNAFVAHPGRVRAVAYTRDGLLWTRGDTELRLWELNPDGGAKVARIAGESLHSADVSRDGNMLLAGGGLSALHSIDVNSLQVKSLDFGCRGIISSIAIAPDGRRVAAATYANAVFLWNSGLDGGPPLQLDHPHRVSHVCFSPDGKLIATSCDDFLIRIWRSDDGVMMQEFRAGADRVPQIAFDPSGKRLAAAVRDGSLRMIELESGKIEDWPNPSKDRLRAVRFSPDGHWVVAAGSQRAVCVWNAETHERVACLTGHNQEIFCLDVGPGNIIASGDSAGTIRLWDIASQRPLATLEGHAASVMSLSFSAEGGKLASASLDGTLRIWDLNYYRRHIAGNVAVNLARTGADGIDPQRAAAWREWARRELQAFAPQAESH